MINVLLTLEDYDGWQVKGYRRADQIFQYVPRKGELIKFDGCHYKVREVTHEMSGGIMAPIIHVYAKAG